ncbi:cell surface protein, partial [Bacillus cereus]|nr:cell surface protein [Bacillus cereus]
YSQFLYNSINAVEKETKPEVKPDPKPEEKPEVKPDPKPEEKPEVKPDPKPEVPAGVDANLVQPNFKYNPTVLENPNVKQQLAPEAQNLLKEINNKYNTNLKYDNLNGAVTILDKDMYYPEGSYIGGQFVIEGGGNKFKIGFLDNNEATVELTKRWVTYLTGLNVDQEIQETINAKGINNYVKGNYKVRIGQTMVQNTMYIYVEAK